MSSKWSPGAGAGGGRSTRLRRCTDAPPCGAVGTELNYGLQLLGRTYNHVNERCRRRKQGHANNKAKQHNTPKAVHVIHVHTKYVLCMYVLYIYTCTYYVCMYVLYIHVYIIMVVDTHCHISQKTISLWQWRRRRLRLRLRLRLRVRR